MAVQSFHSDRELFPNAAEAEVSWSAEALCVQPVHVVLRRVAAVARDTVRDADVACVAARHGRRMVGTEFAGVGLAEVLDERQFEPDVGPSIDVVRHGRPVVLDVAGTSGQSEPYGEFALWARRHGVRRLVSVPIVEPAVADRTGVAGSLTVYTRDRAAAGDTRRSAETERSCRDLARAASGSVVGAVMYAAAVAEAGQLREAMDSRAVIEQAKGMIMYSAGCSQEEAFQRLREASSRSNRKLRDVAAAVVRSAGHPSPSTRR